MSADSPRSDRIARRLSIRGVVQGVGFRPLVYRAAKEHRVAGWVLNDTAGLEIHAEALAADIAAFVAQLRSDPPAAAQIASFAVRDVDPQGFPDFQIRASRRESAPTTRISPDLAICADCLAELRDPSDRRHHYPYINCTACGPRYSIVESLPYDRANTTMRSWNLCPCCRREYEDPLDRRYHAQPLACPECGPGYQLVQGAQVISSSETAIRRAAEMLRAGGIVAVKGIGGYHLACDARSVAAVEALRTRKYRKEKPFALLAEHLEQAHELVHLTPQHQSLLLDAGRPIVLAAAKVDLPGIAPDNATLGVMLPYAPLHYLLFAAGAPSPLVLTSANRSSEPIAYRDDDARERLAGIADALLVGERPIARRVDDSVVAVRMQKPLMIRRARGFAPGAVCRLPTVEPILALGADLKNSIALVVDGEVIVSQHIGDLGDCETDSAFESAVHDLLSMYEINPAELTVAHDLHPQFTSTRFAATLAARRQVPVQHHQAHVASVLAEHQLFDQPVVGVAFDGTGYGSDGSIWGGEFFVGSVRAGFERAAWLRAVRMPGGDAAARFPVQAAAGFLAELGELPDLAGPPFLFPRRFQHALAMVAKDVRCFVSTSVGRLFDAVAALLGFTGEVTFEGQAAMWLEHLAGQAAPQAPFDFPDLDHRPLLQDILADRLAGRDPAEIARAFHASLAAATVDQIRKLCAGHQLSTVALSGGVFQNELLLDGISSAIQAGPLPVNLLMNRSVPAGDGGIALGQSALASLQTG